MRVLFVIALLGACSALAPARARAWTDTTVTQVSASLDTTQPTTRVQLAVSVHVTGGWITRFEMTGLDEDFTLAPDAPPVFETPAGERFVPEAMRGKEAGALDLVFADRHAAPHRGDYVLRLVYTTDAPLRAATHLDARTLRLRWRLPTWSVSLANVHVDIVAPHGTRPAADGGIDDALGDASVTPLDAARTQIALLRAHLPRGQVLEVALDLPAGAYPAQSVTSDAHATLAAASSQRPTTDWLALAVCLAVAGLALGKRALLRRDGRREAFEPLALLPLPSRAPRALLMVLACTAAGALWSASPLAAALAGVLGLALVLDRGFRTLPLPEGGEFRPLTASAVASRTRRASAWLDLTTPQGLACLALLHAPWIALAAHGDAASSCEALAFGAWLATPLWITSTRRALPLDTAHALRELMALRHTLRAQAQLRATIELVVYESPSGVLLSPRLRVLPSRVPAGMGKLELALTHGCFRGRLRTAFTWLAVSREDSRADALLARALPAAQREVSHDTRALCERRSVTLSPASDAPELLAWLTRELEVTPARAA